MGKYAKTPALRFAGFTDDWEQRKLETAFDFSVSNNTLSRAELNYEDGEVKSVHYGDVLIKYGSVLDAQIDEIPFITGKKAMDFSGQWLQEGDIIIADTAEDETTGKATEIRHLGAIPVVSGLHTIVCRPTVKMAPYYLGYCLNSDSYHRQLLPLMQGIKVLSLSRSNLVKTEIKYPKSQEEQKQIGSFFRSLDTLITLHQCKYDKLVNIKKSMLEKMFPHDGATVPEIRFPGFTGAWEQRKLSSIYRNIRNAFVGTATPYYVPDGHFYLESNNIKDGQINRKSEVFINDEFYYQQKDKWLHTNDMVMVQSGHVGHTAVIPENLDKTAAHALIMFTDQIEETEPYFLNYQYQTAKSLQKISNITKGNTIKHILSSDMQNFIVDVPSFDEQKRIATFFKNLDNLITLHQRKLEMLKNFKKSCLERMFV